MTITPIADSKSLADFCARLRGTEFVAVDTEFVRENTYWPILCLVQVAGPDDNAALDALAPDIDLTPLAELLADETTLKVFHAGRQDIEIFHHIFGEVPRPIFDSQVAAMVCGFGDQVAYGTLVAKLVGANVEKTSRFADWSRRPLTQKQLRYALGDVTHLRGAYEKLKARLDETGRASWLQAEMEVLSDPATYLVDPKTAWRRIKSRGRNPRFLGVLRAVAAWRELEARRRDIPRNRVIRDDSLLDIAGHTPSDSNGLARTRGLSRGFANGKMAEGLLAAIKEGIAVDESDLPKPAAREKLPNGIGPLTDLLKTLLKLKCEAHEVAPKLIANSDDIERIAAFDDADVPALRGWRHEIFGADALALKNGELGLTADGRRIKVIPLDGDDR